MTDGRKRMRYQVTGRVQGVGYRWFVQRAASAAGLDGWVQNQPDGSVLCEVEGDAAAVAAFAATLQRGPRLGRVDALQQQEQTPLGEAGFTIR